MNKNIQKLLLFQKFDFQTQLSGQEVRDILKDLADPEYSDYYGMVRQDSFYIAEQYHRYRSSFRNSFLLVVNGKISEQNGITAVSGVVRMKFFALISFAPLYFISMLLVIPFPIMFLIAYFAYIKPSNRLIEHLELILEKC